MCVLDVNVGQWRESYGVGVNRIVHEKLNAVLLLPTICSTPLLILYALGNWDVNFFTLSLLLWST